MSVLVLVTYATKYGSTEEVAKAIAPALWERGTQVDIRSARKVIDLSIYSLVVLGAPQTFPLRDGRSYHSAAAFSSPPASTPSSGQDEVPKQTSTVARARPILNPVFLTNPEMRLPTTWMPSLSVSGAITANPSPPYLHGISTPRTFVSTSDARCLSAESPAVRPNVSLTHASLSTSITRSEKG